MCWDQRGCHFWVWAQFGYDAIDVINVTKEEVIDMFVDAIKVGGGHGLECLRRDSSKSRCFRIFDFLTTLLNSSQVIIGSSSSHTVRS